MAEYRICNICGTRAAIEAVMCECGNLLINLPIIYGDMDSSVQSEICESCGEYFELTEEVCPFCGEPRKLTDVSSCTNCSFYFITENGDKSVISCGEVLYGRMHEMGKFISKANAYYVSESHMTVISENEKIYIIDHSRNGTFINGKKIIPNKRYQINVGDVIGMGGASMGLDKYEFFITLMRD